MTGNLVNVIIRCLHHFFSCNLNLPHAKVLFMGAIKSYKCSRGHILKDGNLYIRSNGTRECRKCSRERNRLWREANKPKGDKQ